MWWKRSGKSEATTVPTFHVGVAYLSKTLLRRQTCVATRMVGRSYANQTDSAFILPDSAVIIWTVTAREVHKAIGAMTDLLLIPIDGPNVVLMLGILVRFHRFG
jgi:hypothetical protein